MAWQFYVQPAVTIFALGDSLWRVASGFSGMWLFPLPPPCIQLAWSGDRRAALFVKVTPCTATFLHSLSHPAFSAIVSREPLRSFLYLIVSLPCTENRRQAFVQSLSLHVSIVLLVQTALKKEVLDAHSSASFVLAKHSGICIPFHNTHNTPPARSQ